MDVAGFEALRPYLFSVAYRMLGRATEAEDVVQDAWVRYQTAAPVAVDSLKAYLTTIVTRLCLDRLKSAHATREQSASARGCPEPVLTDAPANPEQLMARYESITMGFLVLLETLSPPERAVFLLREVFDYDYDTIASMLDTTAANCRQLLSRAKSRIAEGSRAPRRTRTPVPMRTSAWWRHFSVRCSAATPASSRRCSPTTSSGGRTAAARSRQPDGRSSAASRC